MSTSYIRTIEDRGWCLYDAGTTELQVESWEDRERLRKPVETVDEGGMYIFVPQPEPSQTLRDAYAVTKGVGPCLRIQDVDSPEYKMLALGFSPNLAVFTRFVLENSEVILLTPKTPELPESDLVVLAAPTAEDTFTRDFDIISPEEFRNKISYANAEWRV